MSAEADNAKSDELVQEVWQRQLLDGDLSPAEYAALVVAHPSYRRATSMYERRAARRPIGRHPIVRARVFLLLAGLTGLAGFGAFNFGWFGGQAYAPALAAAFFLLVTLYFVVRSSAAQEIWLLSHEVRLQRGQLETFEVYGEHLDHCWEDLRAELDRGDVSAQFIRANLHRARALMEARGHEDLVLAILRRETSHYYLAYTSYAPGSRLEERVHVASNSARELFETLDADIFSHFVSFELAGAEHELVALSVEPFGRSERWLLSQLATYCSTAGSLTAR